MGQRWDNDGTTIGWK